MCRALLQARGLWFEQHCRVSVAVFIEPRLSRVLSFYWAMPLFLKIPNITIIPANSLTYNCCILILKIKAFSLVTLIGYNLQGKMFLIHTFLLFLGIIPIANSNIDD